VIPAGRRVRLHALIPGLLLALFPLLPGPAPAAPPPPAASAAQAAPAVPVVGVVDFYSPGPLPWATFDVVPERYAADDLAASLARIANGRFAVLPREAVRQAEKTMSWRTDDVLHYGRMRELAGRLQASRLVVGWIRELSLASGGSDEFPISPVSTATVIVQVFDAAQGRLVTETRESAAEAFATASDILHRALQPAVAPISEALLGAGSTFRTEHSDPQAFGSRPSSAGSSHIIPSTQNP
jgi:hypothetical protein